MGEVDAAGRTRSTFSLVAGGGAVVIPPGGTHEVQILAAPQAPGPHSAVLLTPGGCRTVNLQVTSRGRADLACGVEPTALAFGQVQLGETATRSPAS